jgi:hypothetical protein
LGEYNIYNIYDTCGAGNMTSSASAAVANPTARTGWGTLLEHLNYFQNHRHSSHGNDDGDGDDKAVIEVGGGPPFAYPCGTGGAVDAWMNNPVVRTAIHMPQKDFYGGR